MEKVGMIEFAGRAIDVYEDPYEPLFKLIDVARSLGYINGRTDHLVKWAGEENILSFPVTVGTQKRNTLFTNEMGLYSILGHSKKPMARAWRVAVTQMLVDRRKGLGRNFAEQIEIWDDQI